MSNKDIIFTEATLKGIDYDGYNLKTFQEWKKAGYNIIKGQKAIIKTKIWKNKLVENKETKKKENIFFMVSANLFHISQVKEVQE